MEVRQKYAQPDLRVVVFKMAEHEYVVDVALVQEIIRPTDPSIDLRTGLMHVDGVPEYVEGVVKRRGRIVPVVDLRKHLGLKVSPPTVETCVIIATLPIGPVGFMVDSAFELMWVKTHDFEMPSPVVARVDQVYLQGMAHLGDRFLVMLDLERLFTPGEQRELSEDVGRYGNLPYDQAAVPQREVKGKPTLETSFSGQIDTEAAEAEQEQVRTDPSTALRRGSGQGSGHRLRSLVAFELSGELYGVPVTDVAEIREPLPLMPLPHVLPHVIGLINLRGVVLPVTDLRRKFALNLKPDGPDNRLIILKGLRQAQGRLLQRAQDKSPGYPVALWVDSVHGLARLPRADFQPAPPGVARIDPEYYDQVTTLDGRMLIELNVQKLLAGTASRADGSRREPIKRSPGT
jgi:purine-binding chemotaxis protein CheW